MIKFDCEKQAVSDCQSKPVVGEESEKPPEYRLLRPGETIQPGDEFWNVSSGEWNTYSSDFWGCPISRSATGRRLIAAVEQQREQVAAENTKALVEKLQARLDEALRCNAELTTRAMQLIEERDAALTLRALAESNCCEFMRKYDAAMKELRETRNDLQAGGKQDES